MPCQNPISGCSKGSRGLSVLSRVTGIFTGTTISPSPWSRQCPSRYTIRAGRNLPDKEFRYLRTVIVTAAVYWGFGSELRGASVTLIRGGLARNCFLTAPTRLFITTPLTPPLNLPAPGRCQSLYVVLIDLAETCVFSKQSPRPFHCGPLRLLVQDDSPTKGTPSPEVTESFCLVP
jgi:hypothetical protein